MKLSDLNLVKTKFDKKISNLKKRQLKVVAGFHAQIDEKKTKKIRDIIQKI